MGQAKRSKVLAKLRWRKQVARLIAIACWPGCDSDEPTEVSICSGCYGVGTVPPGEGEGDDDDRYAGDCRWCAATGLSSRCQTCRGIGHCLWCPQCDGTGAAVDGIAKRIEAGEPFDVADARAYGERLVALEAEFEVFADWTRLRGLGPEIVRAGTFGDGTCGHCFGSGNAGFGRQRRRWFDGDTCRPCKGTGRVPIAWPGPLAREFGWVPCKACNSTTERLGCSDERCVDGILAGDFADLAAAALGSGGATVTHRADGSPAVACPTCARRKRCGACKGRGRTRTPSIANGKSLARLGRRLLAALDGLPSECSACHGFKFDPHKFGRLTEADVQELGRNSERIDSMSIVEHIRHVEELAQLACDRCQGTGRNLHAQLAPVVPMEHQPQLRRRYVDAYRMRHGRDSWLTTIRDQMPWGSVDLTARTRVCPRGQHERNYSSEDGSVLVTDGDLLDARINARWYGLHRGDRAPRWVRGAMRHERRRNRRGRSRGTRGSIREAVLGIPGVTSCHIENVFSGSVSAHPGPIMIVVEGGADEAVAAAIYDSVALVTQLGGNVEVTVEGQPVRFVRRDGMPARRSR